MKTVLGLAGFVAFSVVWIAWMFWRAPKGYTVGVSVMFSPLFWTLALTATFGAAALYLATR